MASAYTTVLALLSFNDSIRVECVCHVRITVPLAIIKHLAEHAKLTISSIKTIHAFPHVLLLADTIKQPLLVSLTVSPVMISLIAFNAIVHLLTVAPSAESEHWMQEYAKVAVVTQILIFLQQTYVRPVMYHVMVVLVVLMRTV